MKFDSLLEQILFTTTRILVTTSTGQAVGTGCFLGYRWGKTSERKRGVFLATNKHVIDDAKQVDFTLCTGDGKRPQLGTCHKVHMPDPDRWWFKHPDPETDIAVMPLVPFLDHLRSLKGGIYFRVIYPEFLPSLQQQEELSPIQEVVFIGYPNGMYDSVNLLPLTRRGVTASPVSVDYCGKPRFLIDASVFPGSSGSPVFVCSNGPWPTDNDGGMSFERKLYFLGMIASVACQDTEGSLEFRDVPTTLKPIVKTTQMIDLGIVIKASAVYDAVAAFLEQHPDFFKRHPELSERIRVPHECGDAVSLITYQVQLLREQNRRLGKRLEDLVRVARDKGLVWLTKNQAPNGSWGKQYTIAVTSFACLAYLSAADVLLDLGDERDRLTRLVGRLELQRVVDLR